MVDVPGTCNCDELCSDYAHCACLLAPNPGHGGYCHCLCDDPDKKAKSHKEGKVQSLSLDDNVSLEMRDASLGEVGKLIAEVANADIYVPAHRVDERRNLSLREVSIETVVQELDLMAVVP